MKSQKDTLELGALFSILSFKTEPTTYSERPYCWELRMLHVMLLMCASVYEVFRKASLITQLKEDLNPDTNHPTYRAFLNH